MIPTVSVLIPAYNAGPWIAESIQSALCQDWGAIEIVVVDDGSTDDTYQIAKSFQGPDVVVISQPNRGASAARNAAFAASSGAYIQYLDADDLLAPSKISAQMGLLRTQGERVLATCGWALFEGTPDNAAFSPNALWNDFSDPVDWLIEAWLGGIWMPPSVWLTPRGIISAAGPWDESLSLHDDGEFFSRVLLASTGVRFTDGIFSYYRKGIPTSLSTQRSLSSIQSHFRVCELYEKHILSRENSRRTRNACAANYQDFIFSHYPAFKDYIADAKVQVKRLGGAKRRRRTSPLFQKLDDMIGWRISKRVQDFVYTHRLSPSQIKTRIASTLK
jgi:glycosyltransferase involved in cell wall biosynthesis